MSPPKQSLHVLQLLLTSVTIQKHTPTFFITSSVASYLCLEYAKHTLLNKLYNLATYYKISVSNNRFWVFSFILDSIFDGIPVT